MFNGTTAAELKADFREKFRNISRIMDCVGCDKCRLWGKLQVGPNEFQFKNCDKNWFFIKFLCYLTQLGTRPWHSVENSIFWAIRSYRWTKSAETYQRFTATKIQIETWRNCVAVQCVWPVSDSVGGNAPFN